MRLPKLYAIVDPSIRPDLSLFQMTERLLQGGARLIQLRHKSATSRELLESTKALLAAARQFKARLIINDRADVAWLTRAHGVHVGQTDLGVQLVRKILGSRQWVGVSTHNLTQALEASRTNATYVAVGPIFSTRTKENSDPVLGLEGLTRIREQVNKPIVAIGGITLGNAAQVIAAGADSVAVISDLLNSKDIAGRTRQFVRLLGT
jgi:thiamine-phosphate pyrophosphorylase